MSLLSIDTNAKTSKNTQFGYLTGILYLAPADLSGVILSILIGNLIQFLG